MENFVESALVEYKYRLFHHNKSRLFEDRKIFQEKQYTKQVPVGDSIYETIRRCDFFVLNPNKFPNGLIIECKWQQVAGSADEKYPFLHHNIVKCNVPTIILLDGDGYKAAAKKWLRSMASPDGPLLSVWSMTEFQKAVNDGFLG